MKAASMSRIWRRVRLAASRLLHDRSGVAATEFAVIVPVMLVMFYGTVEFSSAVAVDRKVTLVARTVSDLTSQTGVAINDTYLQNVFTASIAIIWPYAPTPATVTLSEIYVDTTGKAKVTWSRAATIASGATQATVATSTRTAGDDVTPIVPAALLVKQTYLIYSEVGYLYAPIVGYIVPKAGLPLSDVSFTRPRQLICVTYTNSSGVSQPAGATCPLT
jgi:Flp pilus assembly protein TadG